MNVFNFMNSLLEFRARKISKKAFLIIWWKFRRKNNFIFNYNHLISLLQLGQVGWNVAHCSKQSLWNVWSQLVFLVSFVRNYSMQIEQIYSFCSLYWNTLLSFKAISCELFKFLLQYEFRGHWILNSLLCFLFLWQ